MCRTGICRDDVCERKNEHGGPHDALVLAAICVRSAQNRRGPLM